MPKPTPPRYGDSLYTIVRSFSTGAKLSSEFRDELQRLFNELGERLQAAEEKIAELQKQIETK